MEPNSGLQVFVSYRESRRLGSTVLFKFWIVGGVVGGGAVEKCSWNGPPPATTRGEFVGCPPGCTLLGTGLGSANTIASPPVAVSRLFNTTESVEGEEVSLLTTGSLSGVVVVADGGEASPNIVCRSPGIMTLKLINPAGCIDV